MENTIKTSGHTIPVRELGLNFHNRLSTVAVQQISFMSFVKLVFWVFTSPI